MCHMERGPCGKEGRPTRRGDGWGWVRSSHFESCLCVLYAVQAVGELVGPAQKVEDYILFAHRCKSLYWDMAPAERKVRAGRMLKQTSPIQSALQHSVLERPRSALDMSWMRVPCGPYPKQSADLADTTPADDDE